MNDHDYSHARLPTNFLHDPELLSLTPTGRWMFIALYLFCTEKRIRCLPKHLSDEASIGRLARIDTRTAAKMLHKCFRVGLIKRIADGRIHLVNIDEYAHGNTRWRDTVPGENAPNIPDKKGDSKRGSKTISEIKAEESSTKNIGNLGPAIDRFLNRSAPAPAVDDALPNDYTPANCVRFIATGSPHKATTDTLEDLAASLSGHVVRECCIEALKAKRAGRIDTAAGLLTSMLKKRQNGNRMVQHTSTQ